MKAFRFALGSLIVVVLSAYASPAQVQRTFVSGLGNDGNPCSRAAPCRTFTQAISQTNAAGEVIVLDSAGYGPTSITQAISIIAPPGVYAGISVFPGLDGIDISAGASDTVVLRGLTLNNQGSVGSGIVFFSQGTLHVESCVVNGFSVGPNSAGIVCNGFGKLEVKDSILRGNSNGIVITGDSAVAVDQVRLEGNSGNGLLAQDGAKVTVRNSVASGNGTGFRAFSDNSELTRLNIEGCVASNNANVGIVVVTTLTSTGIPIVRVSNSTVTENVVGLNNAGASVLASRGNNTVEGNTFNTLGIIGSYAAK